MFSHRQPSFAFERSREAIAAISHQSLRCIAGMTFVDAIFAVPKIPQRTFAVMVDRFT
jgi:hypothetical protein